MACWISDRTRSVRKLSLSSDYTRTIGSFWRQLCFWTASGNFFTLIHFAPQVLSLIRRCYHSNKVNVRLRFAHSNTTSFDERITARAQSPGLQQILMKRLLQFLLSTLTRTVTSTLVTTIRRSKMRDLEAILSIRATTIIILGRHLMMVIICWQSIVTEVALPAMYHSHRSMSFPGGQIVLSGHGILSL